jgi:hypothetical protein
MGEAEERDGSSSIEFAVADEINETMQIIATITFKEAFAMILRAVKSWHASGCLMVQFFGSQCKIITVVQRS